MGMTDLFVNGKADLSGMDGTKQLFLSDIVHRATIDVNERGTEVAAASRHVVCCGARGPDYPRFFANHPFLSFIYDNASKSILFMGRVVRPSPADVVDEQDLLDKIVDQMTKK